MMEKLHLIMIMHYLFNHLRMVEANYIYVLTYMYNHQYVVSFLKLTNVCTNQFIKGLLYLDCPNVISIERANEA